MTVQLLDLPESVHGKIIDHLYQQDVVNLAQTNFKFYRPCMKKLYRRLQICKDPILKSGGGGRRGRNFKDSLFSVIGGFQNREINGKFQNQLIEARIKTLIRSLMVNQELIGYIQEVVVDRRGVEEGSRDVVNELIKILGDDCKVVTMGGNKEVGDKMIEIELDIGGVKEEKMGDKLRKKMEERIRNQMDEKIRKKKSESGVRIRYYHSEHGQEQEEEEQRERSEIPGLQEQQYLTQLEDLKHHTQKHHTYSRHDPKFTHSRNDAEFTHQMDPKHPGTLPHNKDPTHPNSKHLNDGTRVKDFTHVGDCNPDFTDLLHLPEEDRQDLSDFDEVSIFFGCDNPSCNQTCYPVLSSVMSTFLTFTTVESLSFNQINSTHHINTHEDSVQWDLTVFQIISQSNISNLSHLLIDHKVKELFEDGVDGNYLKRLSLYTETLPRLLSVSQRLITLEMPHFLTVVACYEQPMNNLLWNGCKCAHCNVHLGILDEFIMSHKIYSAQHHCWKDLISCHFFISLGDELAKRRGECSHRSTNDPLFKVGWDLHTNRSGLPFLCLNHHTVDEGEFDEEDKEFFYDAPMEPMRCDVTGRNKSTTSIDQLAICMSHYFNDILLKMVALKRGDAESFTLGGENEHDGDYEQVFKEIELNGVLYAVGNEANGTNWITCISDGA
ncbi:hypothetical protein CAAN1_04S02520 [[Candida] anglica]|uniref:F-box domain-containing protein n=1 Tax=[Candida] anglica TaxID=148631 RepID=A0ABP0E8Z8_9ASCO